MKQNNYVLVLGATGGIGQAICHQLAKSGWSIYIHFNERIEEAKKLRSELAERYPQLEFLLVQGNFLFEEGANQVAHQVQQARAIVIANGQSMNKLLTETTTADMEALWRVHVQNPAQLVSLLSARLRKFTESYIVFIGSIWGNTGAAGEVMYSAVKGAQHAFVKAYAKEASYAGIRVNAIAPGWIETRMNDCIPEDEKEMIMQEIPLLTTGTPQHVADLVDFLLSGKADYMTGEILKLNGGWYI
ncbi:elongation factor P 5-aminopentanone reductase [Sporosarcina pasteurii]|uniref:3-oxoacyl-[acyl-carrier-protein] reductase FabG n=1 Tax=Sporosarcina pasteurii TaxID=1474 RepID=A0A380BH98_SPOPA|nr:SDR family oxidoreductase [Sporosarcina pasteurii]MDS9470645.1 SDR family oxidoreductase [Sporosarcina pasteurii]QBQ05669.1 SDR family oxidoreductase [Sporosarcina pasteurii]SUJ01399.1 3-oxoacyl-[acyl-carrier-protein] reductase FabG [Sporosarcina pasteurii]